MMEELWHHPCAQQQEEVRLASVSALLLLLLHLYIYRVLASSPSSKCLVMLPVPKCAHELDDADVTRLALVMRSQLPRLAVRLEIGSGRAVSESGSAELSDQ